MRSRPALALVVGSALVLVALAARGTSPVPYGPRDAAGADAPTWTQPPVRGVESTDVEGSVTGASLVALVLFVLVLLGAALLWLLVGYLRDASWRRRRRGAGHVAEESSPDDTPAPAEVLVRGARRALADLRAADSGPPGDAVVAAWLTLERAAAASGTPREAHQTPTEFTGGLLTRHRVDPDATGALRRVYQRARFGSGEVTDADARTAADALERIVRDLG
ncbi:hypothetical protein JOF41_006978 [Saccharothrix coeruleofusca]|uniref:DUF4129 domain-containing protein n=1 Tax=Saccharothrix coeruleofusca TaxID=33919 RepID=UPI001AE260C5|nr:DUF4129 domain-containing protein [Saccharothrix coeruleofusca]MBP2340800.1 hypothetical protein [Saccharothrix coeruleofusca]